MTHRELVDYLRNTSARCRSYGDNASDEEAGRTLLELADEMEAAVLVLENSKSSPELSER